MAKASNSNLKLFLALILCAFFASIIVCGSSRDEEGKMKNEGRTPASDSGLKTPDSGLKSLSPLEDNKPHFLSEFLSAVSTPAISIKQADMNNDNLSDILLTFSDNQLLALIQQSDSITPQPPNSLTTKPLNSVYYLSAYVKTSADKPTKNPITGLSKTDVTAEDSEPEFPAPVIIATEVMDVNKDGYNDIITALAGTLNSPLQIQLGSQTGEFTDASNLLPNLDATVLTKLKVVDVNNDSFEDIILTSIGRLNYEGDEILAEFSPRNYVLLNSGNGAFLDSTVELFNEGFASTRAIDIQVRDFGVDGLNDVLLIKPDGNMLYTWSAESSTMQSADASSFTNIPPSPVNNQSIQLDANGDGIKDTVVLQDGVPVITKNEEGKMKNEGTSAGLQAPDLGLQALGLQTSYVSPYQYKITGPSGLTIAAVNQIGDVVYLEFSSRVPAYVWGNILMTFDPAKLQCVSIEENPNNLYGSWVWWAVATGMPYYGGGGAYYYYDDTGLGSGWAKTWAHIDPGSGPTGTYDNIAGKIRIYTDTSSGYSYTSPLRIGFRVLQTGNADFTVQSNDYMSYDWNNVDAGTTSTVNITESGQSVYKEDVANNVRISISGPVTAEIGQPYTIDTWGEIIMPFRPIGTNVYSWELYIDGALYQRRGFTYGEEHRRSWEFTGATEGAIVYKFRFRDGSRVHGGYGWVEVELTVNVAPPGPHIDSISPLSVLPGDILTITGNGFDIDPLKNTVYFTTEIRTTALFPITSSKTSMTVLAPLNIGAGIASVWVSTGDIDSNVVNITLLTVNDLYQAITSDLNTAIGNNSGEIKKHLQSAGDFMKKSAKAGIGLDKQVDFVSQALAQVMKAEKACGDVELLAYSLIKYRAALLNTQLLTGTAYDIVKEMVRMKHVPNMLAYDALYEALVSIDNIYAKFMAGDANGMFQKMKDLINKLETAEGLGAMTYPIQKVVAHDTVRIIEAVQHELQVVFDEAGRNYANLPDRFEYIFTAITAYAVTGRDYVDGNQFTDAINTIQEFSAWLNENASADKTTVPDNLLNKTGGVNGIAGAGAYKYTMWKTTIHGECKSLDLGYDGGEPPVPDIKAVIYTDNYEAIAFTADIGQGDPDNWVFGCVAYDYDFTGAEQDSRLVFGYRYIACYKQDFKVDYRNVGIKWIYEPSPIAESELGPIYEKGYIETGSGSVTVYHLPVLQDGAKDIVEKIRFEIVNGHGHGNDDWKRTYKITIGKDLENKQGVYNYKIEIENEIPGTAIQSITKPGCGCKDTDIWFSNGLIDQPAGFTSEGNVDEYYLDENGEKKTVKDNPPLRMIPVNGPGILSLKKKGTDKDVVLLNCEDGIQCFWRVKEPIAEFKDDSLKFDWKNPVKIDQELEPEQIGVYINRNISGENIFQTFLTGKLLIDINADDIRNPVNFNDADDMSLKTTQYAYGVGIDLGYGGLAENEEILPGGFLTVNDDDDDNEGRADNVQITASKVLFDEEDDLFELGIEITPKELEEGEVTLKIIEGADKIRVWNPEGAATRSAYKLIAGDNVKKKTWKLTKGTQDDPLPEKVYIEGVNVSGWHSDVEIALIYKNEEHFIEWGDRIRFTVVTIEIANPVDSDGNGNIDDPATGANNLTGNEFTYTSANPGILDIPCKVRIIPDFLEAGEIFKDKIRVRIDAINDSHVNPGGGNVLFQWDNFWVGEPTAGNAVYDAVTNLWNARATFTNLPPLNNDFGRKEITVHLLEGERLLREKKAEIEVFWPLLINPALVRDEANFAKNHPGPNLNSIPAENNGAGPGPRAPNWFYYWRQVIPNSEEIRYAGSTIGINRYGRTPAVYWFPDDYNLIHGRLLIGEIAQDIDFTGGITTGIDCFDDTVQHEHCHAIDQSVDYTNEAFGLGISGLSNVANNHWSFNMLPISPPSLGGRIYNHYRDFNGDGDFLDTEDIDGDGKLDVAEDIDGDGILDVHEDVNRNGVLDDGEDIDGDGKIDVAEDIDGDGNIDEFEDIIANGNIDSENLDINFNDVIDTADPGDIEGLAEAAEPDNQNGRIDVDWGSPGKQHDTNSYDD
ncbi:MAG: IPT/TIG domain-containing protein [Planctomycetes bacterium]|nr:IPT/TIG domain-containing protein [Planctomycetota bacterium]